MNKIKRIKLLLQSKTLRFCKFLNDEKYRIWSYKYFQACGVVFEGIPKYINYDVDFDLTEPNMIFVGNNTVIAKQCILLTHDYTIECGLTAINKTDPGNEMQFLKEIHIGRDCFIGARSFILPGAKIGNNCIIGAGSIVSGVVPDNSMYAGNPARFICKTTEWAENKYITHNYTLGTKKINRR